MPLIAPERLSIEIPEELQGYEPTLITQQESYLREILTTNQEHDKNIKTGYIDLVRGKLVIVLLRWVDASTSNTGTPFSISNAPYDSLESAID